MVGLSRKQVFFPKQKGTPSLVKIKRKNTATLDSARSKKKSKVAVLQLGKFRPLHSLMGVWSCRTTAMSTVHVVYK